jgi:trimethylamine--corrinoid protein Co-methyltransferase
MSPDPDHAQRRRPRRSAPGIRQIPWRRLENPFRPVEILSADHVEAIHGASLRILSEIGVEVLGDRAVDLLAGAGALVDRDSRRVRLDPAHVESLVAQAPSTVTRGTSCSAGATWCSGLSGGRRSPTTSTPAGEPARPGTSSVTSGW